MELFFAKNPMLQTDDSYDELMWPFSFAIPLKYPIFIKILGRRLWSERLVRVGLSVDVRTVQTYSSVKE